MKIAVCISGMLRNYKHTHERFKRFVLDPLQPDVFFYGYENNEGRVQNEIDVKAMWNPVRFSIEKYTPALQEELRRDHNADRFATRKVNETNIDGLLSQYRNVYKCNELKSFEEERRGVRYDVVIKARCDVFFARPITQEEVQIAASGKMIHPDEWYFRNFYEHAVTDAFAMSNSYNMDKYADIYNKIGTHFDDGCIFHHESITGWHMKHCGFDRHPVPPHFWFEYPTELSHISDQNRRSY